MDRFSQRDTILLGYNLQTHRSSTNPSTPNRNSSDIDFHDVFGGPPRRSSVHEMRYGIGDLADLGGSQMEDEADSGSCAWPPGVREKPVFGEDNLNRRRYPNDNFYDDIFGGDESSPCCTPRKHERHPFSATPGSRIMSPALPLPPAPDSFAPSSLPSALSLPAKSTKGMDLPTFGSSARSLRKNVMDSTSNGLTSSDSPAAHLSRFSSHSTHSNEDLKNGSRTSRQSHLPQEVSDKGGDSASHFHFSIYKWASKGVVPLVMPLRADRSSRTKGNFKLERCSSAKDWIPREHTSQDATSLAYTASSSMNNREQVGSTAFTNPQKGADSRQFVEEIVSAKSPLETLSTPQHVTEDVLGSASSRDTQSESSVYSLSEVGFSGKTKGDSVYAKETHKPESKPLHSLFSEDHDEKTIWEKGKESKTKKSSAVFDVGTNPKKGEKKTVAMKGVEVNKATSQGSLSLEENMGNARVTGKVKDFVRIFSQESPTKPSVDAKSRIQVSEFKLRSALRTNNEVEDNHEHFKKENPAEETTNISGDDLSRQDDISASAIPDSTVPVGDKDEFFHGILVKELAQDENEVSQTQDSQEIKVIDDKIRKWSKGKEGNIRSLLSTLQYVLWPESGWKPVPLVDIIEGNAVKRAYQKALLCLHPDKLQQKGAASHQKYIAEKVFDILQEAWTHFNMLGAL